MSQKPAGREGAGFAAGFKTLRFWKFDFDHDINAIVDTVYRHAESIP